MEKCSYRQEDTIPGWDRMPNDKQSVCPLIQYILVQRAGDDSLKHDRSWLADILRGLIRTSRCNGRHVHGNANAHTHSHTLTKYKGIIRETLETDEGNAGNGWNRLK